MANGWDNTKIVSKIHAAAGKAVSAGAIIVQDEIVKLLNLRASNRSNGSIPSPAGGPPANRSGTLSRSIQIDSTKIKAPNPLAKIGPNIGNVRTPAGYARVQEFGGIIRAKRSKYLTIPVNPLSIAASEKGLSAKEAFPDAFLMRGKRGKLMLCRAVGKTGKAGRKNGKGNRVEILYILKRFVVLPPRPYVRPGAAIAMTKVPRVMAETFKGAMLR